ncbi:MAG: histidine triad nucleotide-binding protein [Gammaproteobacteria bacterium]|nr:histidine triad nucleotide-binding protein [Gammaproteobacteria bacterium]
MPVHPCTGHRLSKNSVFQQPAKSPGRDWQGIAAEWSKTRTIGLNHKKRGARPFFAAALPPDRANEARAAHFWRGQSRYNARRLQDRRQAGHGPGTNLVADSIFGKIIRREIPADIIYEDELCLAFRDVNPRAPVHVLVVPKKTLLQLSAATDEDQSLLGHMLLAADKIAGQLGVGDAYRLVVNNGAGAGQTVFHLHLHLLAGRPFTWPPG